MEKAKIPFFKKSDLDASIGVFFDGFSKVIVAIAVMAGTLGISSSTIFGTMMPGVFLTVLIMNGGLWLYYRQIAAQRNDPDLTAVPAGLQAGRMFIWLFSIMLPVYLSTSGRSGTSDWWNCIYYWSLCGSDPVKDRSSRRIIRFPGRWCYGIPDFTAYERHFKYAGCWLVIDDRFIYHLYRTR